MERIQLKDWADFRAWVDRDLQVMPVYWRGQKDPDWPLASSFERTILRLNGGWEVGSANVYPYGGRFRRNGNKMWSESFYADYRDRYLRAFQRASSGLRGHSPADLNIVSSDRIF